MKSRTAWLLFGIFTLIAAAILLGLNWNCTKSEKVNQDVEVAAKYPYGYPWNQLPPQVQITNKPGTNLNTFYPVPLGFTVHTHLDDLDGRVTDFKIYVNGTLLDSVHGNSLKWDDRPYSLVQFPAGNYSINIWARDNDGNPNADAMRISLK